MNDPRERSQGLRIVIGAPVIDDEDESDPDVDQDVAELDF